MANHQILLINRYSQSLNTPFYNDYKGTIRCMKVRWFVGSRTRAPFALRWWSVLPLSCRPEENRVVTVAGPEQDRCPHLYNAENASSHLEAWLTKLNPQMMSKSNDMRPCHADNVPHFLSQSGCWQGHEILSKITKRNKWIVCHHCHHNP